MVREDPTTPDESLVRLRTADDEVAYLGQGPAPLRTKRPYTVLATLRDTWKTTTYVGSTDDCPQ